MLRDPATGFEYPFYDVTVDVWNADKEEYEREHTSVQTYEEALKIVRKAKVNADIPQITIEEEYEYSSEAVAVKAAVNDDPSGYYFYDPRTDKSIA